MPDDLPTLDLDGYRRQWPLERELYRWSPAWVALTLAAIVGLLLVGVGGLVLHANFGEEGDGHVIGVVAVLAGALFFGAYVGLGNLYKFRLLARLRCLHCGGALGRYVADLGEAERGRWGVKGVVLDGRRYSAPFLGDGDRRKWVRAMKEVWACVACRGYVDSCEPHERTCSEDELARLRNLFGNGKGSKTMTNLEKLRRAFQTWNDTRGASVADWLLLFAEDVVLHSLAGGAPGMEFSAARRGRAEAEHYFNALRDDWEMIHYTAAEFITEGDRVAVHGRCAWRNRQTGKQVESPVASFWRFRDGLVVECFEFYDTAAAFAAARPD
jgi:ketosteroid isomerase-like protein